MRILLLGGTSEALLLARHLAVRPGFDVTLSLAGRTAAPVLGPVAARIGGFGGVAGLSAYLGDERIDAVVDATHPYAARISAHALAAAKARRRPLIVLLRPPWMPIEGDRWQEVEDNAAACLALGPLPRRVFLTIGAQGAADLAGAGHHHYVVRAIERPNGLETFRSVTLLQDRGPFDLEAEAALLVREAIDVVVSKNAGGASTYGKIAAARRLGLPVVMVRRPVSPVGSTVETVEAALEALDALSAGHKLKPY